MKKSKKVLIFCTIIFLILAAILASYIIFKKKYNDNVHTDFETVDDSGKDFANSQRINILVLGMEGPRTDMIMVATFDPKIKKLDMISVPRDTYVENDYTPEYKKINTVYAYPSIDGGIERIASKVSQYLGIPITDYVQIEYDAVFKLADAVGGVDIDIPFDMYYDDPWSKPFPLHIHFKKGINHIDGQNAVQYLRWRHNNDHTHSAEGDVGRVHRQQDFMKKVLDKAISEKKIPQMMEILLKNVKTSLEFEQAMGLAKLASTMSKEDIHFYQEVGEAAFFDRFWYFVADKDKTHQLMEKIINNETITDEDLNPSKEFEEYIYTIDESPFNPKRHNLKYDYSSNTYYRNYQTDYNEDNYVPKKRKTVNDTTINDNEDEEDSNQEKEIEVNDTNIKTPEKDKNNTDENEENTQEENTNKNIDDSKRNEKNKNLSEDKQDDKSQENTKNQQNSAKIQNINKADDKVETTINTLPKKDKIDKVKQPQIKKTEKPEIKSPEKPEIKSPEKPNIKTPQAPSLQNKTE